MTLGDLVFCCTFLWLLASSFFFFPFFNFYLVFLVIFVTFLSGKLLYLFLQIKLLQSIWKCSVILELEKFSPQMLSSFFPRMLRAVIPYWKVSSKYSSFGVFKNIMFTTANFFLQVCIYQRFFSQAHIYLKSMNVRTYQPPSNISFLKFMSEHNIQYRKFPF